MKCPSCEHENSRVMESRDLEDGASIRRRRECLNCCHRFTTYERIERPPLMVVKKPKKLQLFLTLYKTTLKELSVMQQM